MTSCRLERVRKDAARAGGQAGTLMLLAELVATVCDAAPVSGVVRTEIAEQLADLGLVDDESFDRVLGRIGGGA